MNYLMLVIQSFYFMLPAFAANISPVFFTKLKFLDYPLDFNKKIFGKPIFGKNKTWRGLVFGTIIAGLVFYIQKLLFPVLREISIIDYSNVSILLGFLLGLGAFIGDAIESFVKRQLNKKPGSPFIPFDQLDFLIGAFLLGSIIYFPPWKYVICVFIVSPVLHIIINIFGYHIGLRKDKL